jgi:hypothetical protein
MQGKGVFSTGKHFPGHGIPTQTPTVDVSFSKQKLEVMEFYPYKRCLRKDFLLLYLNVPTLESKPNYPSSISYNVVTNVLQKELGFQGLIFTDALNMKAVSKFSTPASIYAFSGGERCFIISEDAFSVRCFRKAYQDSLFTDRLASSKKILKFKYRRLEFCQPINIINLYKDLNSTKNGAKLRI